MAFSNTIDSELGLICFVVTGYITFKRLLELEKVTFNDPARRPNMKIIADLRRASIDVDLDSIKGMLSRNRELNQTGWELEKTVVLTHSKSLVTLAEAYELMGGSLPLKLKVCKTLDEAITWLELGGNKERVRAIHQRLMDEVAANP